MAVKTPSKSQKVIQYSSKSKKKKSGPSVLTKKHWEAFLDRANGAVEYVQDRYNHFTADQRKKLEKQRDKITDNAKAKFKKEYNRVFKHYKKLPIRQIEFIPTHQRVPLFEIIKKILSMLLGIEVEPIRIAVIQHGRNVRYICYDGQHTLIVFYLLGFKSVSVDLRSAENLAEVRTLFRLANGKRYSVKVCHVEDFRQEVLRYIEDGIRDKASIAANQIYKLLMANNMRLVVKARSLYTLSRVHELYDLKKKEYQQMFLDCYLHRINKGIYIDKYPGLGSKEARFYYVMIISGYTVKQINKVTDYLYDIEGTTTAFADSDFWNNVGDYANFKEGETALRFLLHEYEEYRDLEDYGVVL